MCSDFDLSLANQYCNTADLTVVFTCSLEGSKDTFPEVPLFICELPQLIIELSWLILLIGI